MLSRIIRFSLSKPMLVIAVYALFTLLCLLVLARAKYDVFPEFVPPQTSVQTEAPGLNAELVEQLITHPLEQAMLGISGIDSLRSESISGLSVITVNFADGTDPLAARQRVAEKLSELSGQLPAGTAAPKLTPLVSSTMDLLKIGFVGKALSPLALRELIEFQIRPRLLSVPGVARTTIFGGEREQISVRPRLEKMRALDVSMIELTAAIQASTGIRTSGSIDTQNQRIVLQTFGQAHGAQDVSRAVLRAGIAGAPSLLIGDVAMIDYGAEPSFGDAVVMGKPGVLLTLSSQLGANTLEVTYALEKVLATMTPELRAQGIQVYPNLHRPANFIEAALRGIRLDLYLGSLLIACILLAVLRSVPAAIVSFVSIPVSLLATLLVVHLFGWTINTMTLGGLAVALGVIVDDAIIDVENMIRRLRLLAANASQKTRNEVVFEGALEVRAPVLYATLVVALVLLPVLLLSGLQGRFFAPLAATFIVSTLASLWVALTLTPALAVLFLTGNPPRAEPRWLRALKSVHGKILRAGAVHARLLISLSVLCFAGACALLPQFSVNLLPEFREGHLVLAFNATPGTGLKPMRELGIRLSEQLLAIKGVVSVEQQIGRAEAGEDTWGPHKSELHVELAALRGPAQDRVHAQIVDVMEEFPGFQTEAMTFLGDRLRETLSGETAPLVINVYGNDLAQIDQVAAQVAAVISNVPNANEVRVKSGLGLPELDIELDRKALAQWGFSATEVLDAIAAYSASTPISRIYQGERVLNIALSSQDNARFPDPESLGELRLQNAAGTRVALASLAEITMGEGRESISHDGGRRRQVITINPSTPDISAFASRMQTALTPVKLPPGVSLEVTGSSEAANAAAIELAQHCGIALLLIAALLIFALGARNTAMVLLSTPFALIGGLAVAWFTGKLLSIGALVGFVTLFGIAARNAILLLAHFDDHQSDQSDHTTNLAQVLAASTARFTPIFLTALVTALALVPLALESGEAGREVQGPMAQVILAGLITSTLLNLLIFPWILQCFGRARNLPIPASLANR
jgi:CzcA family heavy metal efflux pump